jgi:hypothetical protein
MRQNGVAATHQELSLAFDNEIQPPNNKHHENRLALAISFGETQRLGVVPSLSNLTRHDRLVTLFKPGRSSLQVRAVEKSPCCSTRRDTARLNDRQEFPQYPFVLE